MSKTKCSTKRCRKTATHRTVVTSSGGGSRPSVSLHCSPHAWDAWREVALRGGVIASVVPLDGGS